MQRLFRQLVPFPLLRLSSIAIPLSLPLFFRLSSIAIPLSLPVFSAQQRIYSAELAAYFPAQQHSFSSKLATFFRLSSVAILLSLLPLFRLSSISFFSLLLLTPSENSSCVFWVKYSPCQFCFLRSVVLVVGFLVAFSFPVCKQHICTETCRSYETDLYQARFIGTPTIT